MTNNLPSPGELKAHQIAYYTQLLAQSKSDKQKRFLRTQLYHLKKQSHVGLHPVSGLPIAHLRMFQESSVDEGRGRMN